MIRGIQRQMIIVKTEKSSIFEAAYFLIRTDATEKKREESDMLREANRIIEENYSGKRKKPSFNERKGKSFSSFIIGSLTGMLLVGAFWLLTVLN